MISRTNTQFVIASLTEFVAAWQRGLDGNLTFTSSGGHLSVNFSCNLGLPGADFSLPPQAPPSHHQPPPPTYQPPPLPTRPRHRGPVQREKNCLRAARYQAARSAASAPPAPMSRPAPAPNPHLATPKPPAPLATAPVATQAPSHNSPPVATPAAVSPTVPVMSPPLPTGTRPRTCTKCGLPSKGHQGPCGQRCRLSAPESLRYSGSPLDEANMSPLLNSRDLDEGVKVFEFEEDEVPCWSCGAFMSSFFPNSDTFPDTCPKCGYPVGPPS